MLKKFWGIVIIIIFISSICLSVNAATTTKLNVIKKASETKYLENNHGYISKTIIDSNPSAGEVTVELNVLNTKKEQSSDNKTYENTEIYILVSENLIIEEEEKRDKYISDINNLISQIFEFNNKTNVGIIGMTGTIVDGKLDETGKLVVGDNDESYVEGTEKNAEIVIKPTNNLNSIMNAIKNMNSSKTTYRINLQAGIRLANNSFSNNTNKILISLYDGVPAIAIGEYSAVLGSNPEVLIKEKHENIATYTRDEILKLKDSGISFILLRPDDTSFDEEWFEAGTGRKLLDFDGSPYVQKLYGTMDKPTYGKMYEFTEDNIHTVITENISKGIKDLIATDISNVKVVDYFPEEIVNNFEFSYSQRPSIGTVSDSIDSKTRTITWDIGTLKGEQIASLRYKLKLKNMNNKDLLNKEIATNEKLILTYNDDKNESHTVNLTTSPTIKLTEVKKQLEAIVDANPSDKMAEKVTVSIKANKQLQEVDGWTLSEDQKTLTKVYTENKSETIHIVDVDDIALDVVVTVNNVGKSGGNNNNGNNNNNNNNSNASNNLVNNNNDPTTAKTELPKTGLSMIVLMSLIVGSAIAIIMYKKYKYYKDIK